MNTPDRLLYALSDLFNTNLYVIGTEVRGCQERTLKAADHWNLKTDITICVDEQSQALVTAFVRIRKALWAYVVVTDAGKWLLFFDNDRAKIRVGAEREFGHGNGMGTLKRLKPMITGAMSWTGGAWATADPKGLVEGL